VGVTMEVPAGTGRVGVGLSPVAASVVGEDSHGSTVKAEMVSDG
jgi:hypothetical protein